MPFHASRLKIERSNKHIADAKVIINASTHPESHRSVVQHDPKTGGKVIKYSLAKKAVLRDLALIIGDAIHNLKTALDYAWLGTTAKIAPHAVSKFAKFPVYASRRKA